MKLSVVTPTHNKRNLLRRTLDSLGRQTLDAGDYEVVVVDDGSTDGTAAMLAAYRPEYTLRVVEAESNRGRAAARNLGIAQARGEVVVFLDDDMELVPGFLEAHLELHADPDRVAGVGNVQNHPEVTMAPIDRYMSTRGAQKILGREPLPWKYFSTNNSSVRRGDLDALGGFDENFTTYGFEDLELGWRLVTEREVTLRFVEGARSLHIHPHTLQEVLEKKTVAGRSSLPYLFGKHPQVRREMGYDRFDSPRRGDPAGLNLRRVVYRALLTPPVYHAVKPFARLSLGKATDLVLDYLVLYHYLQGIREYRAGKGGA